MLKLAMFFEAKSLKKKVIKIANKKQKEISFLKFLSVIFVFKKLLILFIY